MGILEDLLASAGAPQGGTGDRGGMGGMAGQPRPAPAQAGGGGMGGIMMALLPIVLAMLANRGGGAQQAGMNPGGGGLGDILGQVLGGGGAAAPRGGGMGDILGQILGGGGGASGGMGGLGGLLEQLQRMGYGEQASSWVGTGQNQAIPADLIGQIFGQDGLAAIARQAGVSEADASAGLSQLLPEVVDRVTPNGRVPDLDVLTASVDDLSRRFGLG
jgi:uncharacterized protein YidB (DUF937 family)